MDADTKKREAGCTCHQEEGDSECVIHGDCGYCGGQMPRCCAVAGAASVHAARLAAAEARAERAEATVAKYKTALDAINVVRNSIVGLQRFGFSEHAYPLVAALDKAGIEGMPYDTARPHLEGLLGRALEAEATAKSLTAERDYLRAWKAWAGGMAHRLLAANPEPQPPEGCEP